MLRSVCGLAVARSSPWRTRFRADVRQTYLVIFMAPPRDFEAIPIVDSTTTTLVSPKSR